LKIVKSTFEEMSPRRHVERSEAESRHLSGLSDIGKFRFVGRCPTLLIYKAFSLFLA